jgi:HSP20 family protein
MTLPRIKTTSRLVAGDGGSLDSVFDTDLIRWNPLTELTNFRRNMNTLLDTIARPGTYGFTTTFGPAVDVYEKDGKFLVEVALPGLKKDDIDIEVSDNSLTVSGKAKEEKKDETSRYHYREIRHAEFSRTVNFPADIDAEQVTASFDNGILKITVPSTKPVAAKKVAIKS